MKKAYLIISLLLASWSASAQSSANPMAVSLDANFKEYSGEFGNGVFKFRNPFLVAGAGFSMYLNQWLDAGIYLNYGSLVHDPTPQIGLDKPGTLNFNLFDAKLVGKFKFNNGKMLKEDAFLGPYALAGLGFATGKMRWPYIGSEYKKVNAFNFPLGLGVRATLSPRMSFYMQSVWQPTVTDKLDLVESGKKKDKLFEHKFGFSYNLGKGSESKAETK